MHPNSLDAFAEAQASGVFSERHQMILRIVRDFGPLTDRAVQRALGFADGNAVRPRVTELVKRGVLREVGNIKDETTGKTVRLVALKELA